jgi:hypothetical protein
LSATFQIGIFTAAFKYNKMEDRPNPQNENITGKLVKGNLKKKRSFWKGLAINPVLENIISEGGDDFFNYLNWTGLAKEPSMMVLSSMQHYYYDHSDLKGINTLVNLKKLNHIRHLESFLHILYRILPSKSHFIGYFDQSGKNGKRQPHRSSSRFFRGFIHLLDSGSERHLTKLKVRMLLEENGFTIYDMTEINGITYFWSRNSK